MDSVYTIQELGRHLGVSPHTLRYWEKMFSGILSPPRTEGGQRRYDRNSVSVAKAIHRLVRIEGYSIRGARRKLAEAMKEATAGK